MAPILSRLGFSFGFGASLGETPPAPMTATGGTTDTYTQGSKAYKSHKFTSPGNFQVTSLGTPDLNKIDYILVGGGGGGGKDNYGPANDGDVRGVGGGGAGAIFAVEGETVPAAGTYAIAIGEGGAGATGPSGGWGPGTVGEAGGNTTMSGPLAPTKTGAGGGFGSSHWSTSPWGVSGPGGSGGGAYNGGTGGEGTGASGHPGSNDVASPPSGWGNDGGNGSPNQPSNWFGGGGGGASAVGTPGRNPAGPTGNPGPPNQHGPGGAGVGYTFEDGNAVQYAGGGGGGGAQNGPAGGGGAGGGGSGSRSSGPGGSAGQPGTGGGGGGKGHYIGDGNNAYPGGDGICIIRYRTS